MNSPFSSHLNIFYQLNSKFTRTFDKKLQAQIDVIYTDFQKAFDKVNHQILLQKLLEMGFPTTIVTVFGSYREKSEQKSRFYIKTYSDFIDCAPRLWNWEASFEARSPYPVYLLSFRFIKISLFPKMYSCRLFVK